MQNSTDHLMNKNNHYPKTIKTSAQLILFVIVNLPSSKETNTFVDESSPHKVYNRPRTSPANKEPFLSVLP